MSDFIPSTSCSSMRRRSWTALIAVTVVAVLALCTSCAQREVAASTKDAQRQSEAVTVGVMPVGVHELAQQLTVSSELVPFQEIDVYAKEAGYVKNLYVDYGSHVKKGSLMAELEIPELEAQLLQDNAEIAARAEQVIRDEHEVNRVKAQHEAVHLQYQRLADVAKGKPGLVAQQEVDDAQGKDLAAESQMEAVQGALGAAKSELAVSKAKLVHDQALYSYSKITAPFDGVVTQRFANLGALMQAGTSSTQATPLVRLSQENLYRLVIPVPESYVKYVRMNQPVEVRVPSLGHGFAGRIARSSVDVNGSTRTMHTEVDVPNTANQLVPGLYAEAVLTLDAKNRALAVPLQSIEHTGDKAAVMVVNTDNRVEERPITVGMQTAEYAEVTSGLRPGENVVASDRTALKPGQKVRSKIVTPLAYDTQER